MRIQALHQVPPSVERAVIINVATEVVTSLAIASALRHLQMPLLVINCTAEGVSKKFMDTLRDEWNFDLIDLPLQVHGLMLDRLIRDLNVERLTILDSDAEIRDAETPKRMRAAFDANSVYGSGFVHPSQWLDDASSLLQLNGKNVPTIYAERPWIPFASFRTSLVKGAIEAGASFRDRYALGDIHEFVVDPRVRAQGLPGLVYADTGAEVHAWLNTHGLRFDGPDVNEAGDSVGHYHGVSRKALVPESGNGVPLDAIENEVLARLRNQYDDMWSGFATAVKAAQS